jgi:RNA recognition motif-containing protein
MPTKLFIGGLSYDTTEDGLRDAFKKHGDIESVRILTDRETGRSRGFGFIEFADKQAATDAVSSMNGAELDGRTIKVDFASDRAERGGGGGGRGPYSRDNRERGGGRGGEGRIPGPRKGRSRGRDESLPTPGLGVETTTVGILRDQGLETRVWDRHCESLSV